MKRSPNSTPLSRDDVKPRLLGHWGTTPGLNFIYAHLNRVIKERARSTIYIHRPAATAVPGWSPAPTWMVRIPPASHSAMAGLSESWLVQSVPR